MGPDEPEEEDTILWTNDLPSSGDESVLDIIEARNRGLSSADSEQSGPVVQMQRGYTERWVDTDNGEEEELEEVNGTDSGDDMLKGLENIGDVDPVDVDYKNPFGQHPTSPKCSRTHFMT